MGQQALRLVGGAIEGGFRDVPAELLLHCRTYQDALRVGMKYARRKMDDCKVAELLGISKGHFNKILNCDLSVPGPKRKMMSEPMMDDFENIVGNNALSKYWQLKGQQMLDHQQAA